MKKVRVMGESTQKALRRTPMHKKLTEGVRDLIRLYYLLKKKKPFIPEMKDFLNRITEGEGFKHRKDGVGSYYFSQEGMSRLVVGFNDNTKRLFLKSMDMLEVDIKGGIVFHFYPGKCIYKIEADVSKQIKDKPSSVGVWDREFQTFISIATESLDKEKEVIPEQLVDKHVIEALKKQQFKSKDSYYLSGRKWKQGNGNENDNKMVTISTTVDRTYRLFPYTKFGAYLLKAIDLSKPVIQNKKTHRNESFRRAMEFGIQTGSPVGDEISSISFKGWINFFELARTVLVNYHLLFGNYKYIKVCEWCEKLFVEERRGRGHFCNDDCRRKFKQASPKYKCWNRQTTWIRRKVEKIKKEVKMLYSEFSNIRGISAEDIEYEATPGSVSLYDCQRCNTCMVSGECTVLIRKNREILSIPKGLPAIREELKNRKINKKNVLINFKRFLKAPIDTHMIDR